MRRVFYGCGVSDIEALAVDAAGGDSLALDRLLTEARPLVFSRCRKFLPNELDAEEATQDTLLAVARNIEGFEGRSKFTTWLFTITKNLVYNESRRRKRRPHYSLEAQEEDFHLAMPDTSVVEPDDALLHQEMKEAIDAAMEKLPERQRMALILRRFEHLPYEEIAKTMDLTVSSVKSLLFRARLQLREELRSYLEDEES